MTLSAWDVFPWFVVGLRKRLAKRPVLLLEIRPDSPDIDIGKPIPKKLMLLLLGAIWEYLIPLVGASQEESSSP